MRDSHACSMRGTCQWHLRLGNHFQWRTKRKTLHALCIYIPNIFKHRIWSPCPWKEGVLVTEGKRRDQHESDPVFALYHSKLPTIKRNRHLFLWSKNPALVDNHKPLFLGYECFWLLINKANHVGFWTFFSASLVMGFVTFCTSLPLCLWMHLLE